MITIYKITNRQNLKIYIGQTCQSIEQRFLQHSKALTPLGEAMRQCGLEDLAKACGFSKAYIGALEKGINPSTGKPYSPTIQTFEKIAKGTGQDLDSLFKALDGDQLITLNAPSKTLSDEQENTLKAYDELNSEGRRDFWSYLEFLKFKYPPVVGANFKTNLTVG